jgi:probable phosphoglycerate mutase
VRSGRPRQRPRPPLQAAEASTADVVLVFDGGSKGNPGLGYGSYAFRGAARQWPPARLEFPGLVTNNQAEYRSLLAGLTAVIEQLGGVGEARTRTVEVRTDSQLVVEQLNGRWKVRNAELKPLHAEALAQMNTFQEWDILWHPRAESVRILGH